MQMHIANVLLKTLENPQSMLTGNGVSAQLALETIQIEADALAKALGPGAVDGLAVNFLKGCEQLPTDGLYDGDTTRSELGRAAECIDQIGHIIISRMGGNPWDKSMNMVEMTTRLNRLHYAQMAMDGTLRAALAHPGAPAMADIQVAGVTRSTRCVDATPMQWAVSSNNTNLVRIWFEYGMDPNVRDTLNNTPMARAVSAEMVSTLLAGGASLDDVDGAGAWGPDHWKNLKLSDSARMQMMSQAMGHLLEGNGRIDRVRAKSMVMNLPAVKKMQAAMDRSGVGWWDGDPSDTVGKALCCQVAMIPDKTTSSAIKRMQSLVLAARSGSGSQLADNNSLLTLAESRLAVVSGKNPRDHIIRDAGPIPRTLGIVMEEGIKTMPAGIGTLKDMAAVVANTHQLLDDGLSIDRAWLEPLSRAASKCIELGTSGSGAQCLLPWLVDMWVVLDQDTKEDLLPLLVPLVFYSQAYNSWDPGTHTPLLDAIMDTPCNYQDRPEKSQEFQRHADAFRDFAASRGDIILKEKLKPAAASLNAKAMQVSCAPALENNTRPGLRF